MLWGCFSANGPGNLVKVEGIIRKEQYIKILKENLKQAAENLNLGDYWTYSQSGKEMVPVQSSGVYLPTLCKANWTRWSNTRFTSALKAGKLEEAGLWFSRTDVAHCAALPERRLTTKAIFTLSVG